MLRVAALFDRRFRISDLEALGLFSPLEVRAAITATEEQRLCVVSGDRCTFAHDTLRERRRRTEAGGRGGHPPAHRRAAARAEGSPGDARLPLGEGGPAAAGRQRLPARQGWMRTGCWTRLAPASTCARPSRWAAPSPSRPSGMSCWCALSMGWCGLAVCWAARWRCSGTWSWAGAVGASHFGAAGGAPERLGARLLCSGQLPQGAGVQPAVPGRRDGAAPALLPLCALEHHGAGAVGLGAVGPSRSMLTEAAAQSEEAGEHVEQTHSEGILALALAYAASSRRPGSMRRQRRASPCGWATPCGWRPPPSIYRHRRGGVPAGMKGCSAARNCWPSARRMGLPGRTCAWAPSMRAGTSSTLAGWIERGTC